MEDPTNPNETSSDQEDLLKPDPETTDKILTREDKQGGKFLKPEKKGRKEFKRGFKRGTMFVKEEPGNKLETEDEKLEFGKFKSEAVFNKRKADVESSSSNDDE
jgi:hypothetical protein